MSNEPNNTVLPEDPSEAQPGRGAPGDDHVGVQMAQDPTLINAPDAIIPSNAPTEESVHQLEAFEEQEKEEGEGFTTTDGFLVDEAGLLNNFAIEPPMYYEGEEPPVS